MKIVRFSEVHTERWDRFCFDNPHVWFWHTTYRMRHSLDCSFSIKSANHSFFIEENGEMVAIAPLTIDDHKNPDGSLVRQMSYGGLRVPAPMVKHGVKNEKASKLYKTIFPEIDRIAMETQVKRLVTWITPVPVFWENHFYHNFLMKFGFNDVSLNTQIVDLRSSEDEIFSGFEENHRRAVKKAQKYLEIELHDHRNITSEKFEQFKAYYFRIAGKVTRPENTFELLYFYLSCDMAVLGEARYKGRVVGYVACIYYKKGSFYLMGASERDFDICPIAHLIHWEIMKYLKDKGIHHYEAGVQQYGSQLYDDPTEKDKSISRFKRGFGGYTLPVFIGEKFYDMEYFEQVLQERIKAYKSSFLQKSITAL